MKSPEESARQSDSADLLESGVRCLDDEEVLAFLDRQLAGARLRAVERHLDGCESCRQLVGCVAQDDTNLSATVKSTDRGLRAGDTLDHFRIERRIGVGGMGEIYLATDTELLRPVALKLIAAKLVSSVEARDRLIVEARATARIQHPGIVQIHSVGVHDGRPYLALEHVEGETLKAYLDRGKPKLFEILDLGIQMADALAAAHAEGVLHRDLKPHNAIIGRDGRIRLLDFGLAKVRPPVDADEDDLSSWYDVTQADPSSVRGTPGYMAPEQWKNEDVNAAADVWGLGVVLYEMITGQRPYRESSAISYAVKVCGVDPVPALGDDAGVPEGLRRLVSLCLDKDPSARPSAIDVASTLQSVAEDDAVQLARSLDEAADEWSSSGETPHVLWRGRTLERAERVLRSEPFMMDARSTGFLSASVHEDHRRQSAARARLRAVGGIALGFGVLASVFAYQNVEEKQRARAERDTSEMLRAETLVESAESDWTSGRWSTARAKLRSALEIVDSTRARVLLWRAESSPNVWTHDIGAGAYDLAVTADGRRVYVAAHDGVIYEMDTATLETRALRGLSDQALEVDVSSDGTIVAAAARDASLMIWQPKDGTRRALGPTAERLGALAITPDARRLVGADRSGGITVFDLVGSQDPVRFSARAGVLDLVVADGAVFTAERDGHVRVYDLATHTLRREHAAESAPLVTLAIASGTVAAADDAGRLFVWSPDGGRKQFQVSSRAVQRVTIVDRVVFVAGTDRVVRRVALDGGEVRAVATHGGGVWALANVDGDVVSGSLDGQIRRTRIDRLRPRTTDGAHTDGATAVQFSPDGRRVFSGGYDRTLRVWDAETGAPLAAHTGHDGTIYDIATRGDIVVTASHDRTARVWRGDDSDVLAGHTAGVYAVAIDAKSVHTAGADGALITWDPETLVPRERRSVGAALYGVATDGRRIAVGGSDKSVHVFDGVRHVTRAGHDKPIWGAAFDEGGALYTTSYDGTVRRWTDPSTVVGRAPGRLYAVDVRAGLVAAAGAGAWLFDANGTRALAGHRAEVNDIALSPDATRVVTASDDGTVRVWDTKNGQPVWAPTERDVDSNTTHTCRLGFEGQITGPEFETTWAEAESIVATPTGCVVRGSDALRWYGGRGEHKEIGAPARALARDGDVVLVLRASTVTAIDETGTKIESWPVEAGATAVARLGTALVVGFEDGRITIDGQVLDDVPTAPVTKLEVGPRRTLAAGFENGSFGLWDAVARDRLYVARLHGAVIRLDVRNDRIVATSELGESIEGPSRLEDDRCTVLQRIVEESPVTWARGRVRRAEGGSRCNPS